MPEINPNSDFNYIENCNINSYHDYPKFLHSIEFKPFKQIEELELNFLSPVTIISGTNKIGKTTILTALACSHLNFEKRNATNGKMERHTWSNFMKITISDIQSKDWSYWIKYREGTKAVKKRGQRKQLTNKWNGIAKKESQIRNRQVILIDLDRVLPARNVSSSLYRKARHSLGIVSAIHLNKYLSYIFEESYTNISKLAEHVDKTVFSYTTSQKYSGFNSASGEDVITKILLDIMEAEKNALILIDEIEIGLHPKVQRRLIEVINYLSRYENKQFIITTHSPSIFAHIHSKSRIFIDKASDGKLMCIQNASLNEALSKMDGDLYPSVDIFCEDDIAKKIIQKIYEPIKNDTFLLNVDKLINIIVSGSADKTYANFEVHKRTYNDKKIKTGYLCVLDGDMRTKYSEEDGLFFLPSDLAPEKYLLSVLLAVEPNPTLQYHFNFSDSHILFSKIIEVGLATDKNVAFELCWTKFILTHEYESFVQEFKYFLINNIKKFSK